MKKYIFTISLLLIGWGTPALAVVHSNFPVQGYIDGDNVFFSCEVLPDVPAVSFPTLARGFTSTLSTTSFFTNVSAGSISWDNTQTFYERCEIELDNKVSWPISDMVGQPAGTYYFTSASAVGGTINDVDQYYASFNWTGSVISDLPYQADITTHINYFSPSNGETVATSTSNNLYTGVFITEGDIRDDMYLRLKYVRQQDLQASIANTDLLWRSIDFGDTLTSGNNFLSTTTGDLGLAGTYYLRAELRRPLSWWSSTLSWFNPLSSADPDIVVASTTTFIYDHMTSFDQFVASTSEQFTGFVASSSTSFTQVSSDCNPLTFNLGGCLSGVFTLQGPQSALLIGHLRDNLLSYVPMGYISRFVAIAVNPATTTLPIVSYTFASGPLAGDNIEFDPFAYASFQGGTPLGDLKSDQPEQKSIWEIFEPFYTMLIYLALFIVIIGDISGIMVGGRDNSNQRVPQNNKK